MDKSLEKDIWRSNRWTWNLSWFQSGGHGSFPGGQVGAEGQFGDQAGGHGSCPEANFSYIFRSATFIEIALSNVAVCQRPTFALQKTAKKVDEPAQLLQSRNRSLKDKWELNDRLEDKSTDKDNLEEEDILVL